MPLAVRCSLNRLGASWFECYSTPTINPRTVSDYCSSSVQPGAVKLVLWHHWMLHTQVHPVTSENQFHCTRLYSVVYYLRCPGTLFISHENANFLFSVFRVVQGEAKTPKIMGCCRANFAFLHALKIGTFRGKWTLEWVIKTSHFVLLVLYFLITSKLAFSLIASQRCLARIAKKCLS